MVYLWTNKIVTRSAQEDFLQTKKEWSLWRMLLQEGMIMPFAGEIKACAVIWVYRSKAR
jgi:hypothetical protein